jgi:hypothetical protein
MADVRGRNAGDALAEIYSFEPHRYAPTEDAARASIRCSVLVIRAPLAALSGDDEHGAQSIRASAQNERAQPSLGIGLTQAMQVEASVDFDMTAGDAAVFAPLDRHQRWRRLWKRGACRRRRRRDLGCVV